MKAKAPARHVCPNLACFDLAEVGGELLLPTDALDVVDAAAAPGALLLLMRDAMLHVPSPVRVEIPKKFFRASVRRGGPNPLFVVVGAIPPRALLKLCYV